MRTFPGGPWTPSIPSSPSLPPSPFGPGGPGVPVAPGSPLAPGSPGVETKVGSMRSDASSSTAYNKHVFRQCNEEVWSVLHFQVDLSISQWIQDIVEVRAPPCLECRLHQCHDIRHWSRLAVQRLRLARVLYSRGDILCRDCKLPQGWVWWKVVEFHPEIEKIKLNPTFC